MDGTSYELSYGYNAFKIDMGTDVTIHHIFLENPEYFSQLYVQNLIMYQNLIISQGLHRGFHHRRLVNCNVIMYHERVPQGLGYGLAPYKDLKERKLR